MIAGFDETRPQRHFESNGICKYNFGYMYYVTERGTLGKKNMDDDVTDQVKARRITRIVDLQQKTCLVI
jgi:hypothetical protein